MENGLKFLVIIDTGDSELYFNILSDLEPSINNFSIVIDAFFLELENILDDYKNICEEKGMFNISVKVSHKNFNDEESLTNLIKTKIAYIESNFLNTVKH